MPRRKAKIREDIIENWHLDGKIENSREWKILYALAETDEFNDPYVNSVVTDDTDLLCFAIGFK